MPKPAAFRTLIAACLAATALTPAVARAHDDRDRDYPEESRLDDMSRELRDPMNQAKVVATLSALSGMLLSTDISPLNRAMDSVDGGHRSEDRSGATVGDIAGRGARDLPYHIARTTPQAMGRMAGMLGALEEMKPQLRDMKRQLKDTLRRQGLSGD